MLDISYNNNNYYYNNILLNNIDMHFQTVALFYQNLFTIK